MLKPTKEPEEQSPQASSRSVPRKVPSGRAFNDDRLGTNPGGKLYIGFLAGLSRSSDYLPSNEEVKESRFPTDKDLETLFPKYLGNQGVVRRLLKTVQREEMTKVFNGKLAKHYTPQTEGFPLREDALRYYLKNYLVGFDVMGDELHHPLTPLTHNLAIAVVKRMRKLGQRRFGMRIHALENVSSNLDERKQHIWLLMKTVEKLCEKKVPVRIGHGAHLFWEECDDQAIQDLQCRFRKLLKDKEIAVEINITSNYVLLPNTAGAINNVFLMVKKMLDDKLIVIPGTDNDGIWPLSGCLEHKRHSNIAQELCTMLMHPVTAASLAEIDPRTNKSQLMSMIENGHKNTFWSNAGKMSIMPLTGDNGNERWSARANARCSVMSAL
jgi:hypothetical protein